MALQMFKKAAEVLGRMPTSAGDYATKLELRCLTYSNLAWYYFCTKDYYPALQYAQKAQSSANVSQDQRAMAAAHLNIGCCVSLLGCHDGALDHATKALYLLQAERGGSGANSAVAVCLHNISVEQIQLFRTGENIGAGEALETCTDAIEIAKEVLDPNHAWMRHFKRTFKIAVKMSPSVDALRKSAYGPLKRVKSASPALFAESKGKQHVQPYDEDEDYEQDEFEEELTFPPVQGAQSAQHVEMARSQTVPMRDSPLETPPPVIPLPRRLQKQRIAPPGKLPTLPKNLTSPHAFNPTGGDLLPPMDDEEEENAFREGDENARPLSRAKVLGLGQSAMLGSSIKSVLGADLTGLVKKRVNLIKSIGTQAVPRTMGDANGAATGSSTPLLTPAKEEEGIMKTTLTSSANVVSTDIMGGPEKGATVDAPAGVEEAEEAEEEEEEEYGDDDFEATGELSQAAAAPEEAVSESRLTPEEEKEEAVSESRLTPEEEKEEAARKIQRITRGKQGRKKVEKKREWKNSQDAWAKENPNGKEEAALKIQSITRGKQGRKKVSNKKQGFDKSSRSGPEYEAKLKAGKKSKSSGIYRSDLGEGDAASKEIDRQRATLKIQALSRGRSDRPKLNQNKKEWEADPSKKPAGYKMYSEYHGDKTNPYMVKMEKGGKKKKGGTQGDVYFAKEKAAERIQKIQRGKAARAKVDSVKVEYAKNPEGVPKGFSKMDDPEYDAMLKAGKKGKK